MKGNLLNQIDPQLIDAVNAGCIVVFFDEWGNERTLEARAVVIVSEGAALIGYQLEGGPGVAPEQLWKRIDTLSRVTVTDVDWGLPERSIPPQYTENVGRLLALAPNTAWDQTRHKTSSYDDA